MSSDEVQSLLSEFNKQFNELRKDLNMAMEKLSDKIIDLGQANISNSKDIEAIKSWFDEKIKDIETDINGIGIIVRKTKEEINNDIEEKIKKNNLSLKVMLYTSLTTGMGALLMFFLNKFF